MPNRFLKLCRLIVALALPVVGTSVSAQVLYDGELGLPDPQDWGYFALGDALLSATNSGVILNTASVNSIQAGYARTLPGLLNRRNGFTVSFSAQVVREAHASTNRAGFSLLLLTDDLRGVELGFWTNKVFAQSDLPLFTSAEEAGFAATDLVDYALAMQGSNYTLTMNGNHLLTGPLRDYSAFNGTINPYRTPSLIFFGDNTTSAGGTFILRRMTLISSPELKAMPDGRVLWSGVPNHSYTVLSSSNLAHWVAADSVVSTNSLFTFTNRIGDLPRFIRVSYP